MAVVRLEIKTRQPLADSRKFDHVGCYEQLDGTAHFAVEVPSVPSNDVAARASGPGADRGSDLGWAGEPPTVVGAIWFRGRVSPDSALGQR